MLNLETLYAVLQGLPVERLQHLKNTPWLSLCRRIERHLKGNKPPLEAIHAALDECGEWERQHLRQALALVVPVMQIPGLSYRQRQALVTLRYLGSATLAQLSHTLMADRSNTHRRMQVLVRRGLALRFAQPSGVCYMPITQPLPREVKRGVQRILATLIQEALTPTTSTTSTTPTQPT